MQTKQFIGPDQGRMVTTAPRMITAKAISAMIGVSLRQVYRMAERGIMPPPAKLGTKIARWRIDAIQRWIDLDCPAADADAGNPDRHP